MMRGTFISHDRAASLSLLSTVSKGGGDDDSGQLLIQDMSSSAKTLEAFQAAFKRQGWNLTGANLLAVSCLVAQSVFLYVRPRLTVLDAAPAVILTLVGILIPVGPLNLAGAVVGLILGAGYLLWKASGWRPAEEIISKALDRDTQHKLVSKLVLVCEAHRIDPENLDDLDFRMGKQQGELAGNVEAQTGVAGQFYKSMIRFFHEELKMEE